MSTSVRHLGFDDSVAPPKPQFEIDIDANAKYRIDVATQASLFQSGTGRNTTNFFYRIVHQSGISQFTLPDSAWNSLDLSQGGLHCRVTSWNAQNQNRQVSTPILFDFLPHILSVSPNRGDVNGGTPVTITGYNLSSFLSVEIDGISAPPSSVTDRIVRLTTPSIMQPGAVPVTIRTSYGVSAPSAAAQFHYEAVPGFTAPSVVPPGIVDIRVIPVSASPQHDPEVAFHGSNDLRRGREYKVEVEYDQSFASLPDNHLTLNVGGAQLRISLNKAPGTTNMSYSEPFAVL